MYSLNCLLILFCLPLLLKGLCAVQVPLFIAQGQKIMVDTRTDTYLSKVK